MTTVATTDRTTNPSHSGLHTNTAYKNEANTFTETQTIAAITQVVIPPTTQIGIYNQGAAHGAVLYSNAGTNYATKWGTVGDDPFGAIRAGMLGDGTLEFSEHGDPPAGAANTARLYCRDDGSGKTQLCVRFNTGAVQVLATEP